MNLIDESGEIKAIIYGDYVDRLYEYVEVDKVYYISRDRLNPAKKQFTTLRNDYEMILTNDSVSWLSGDDTGSVPQTQYNFITMDKIRHMKFGSFGDVIGICKTSDLQSFQARSTGKELKTKDVTLVDQSDNTKKHGLNDVEIPRNNCEMIISPTLPIILENEAWNLSTKDTAAPVAILENATTSISESTPVNTPQLKCIKKTTNLKHFLPQKLKKPITKRLRSVVKNPVITAKERYYKLKIAFLKQIMEEEKRKAERHRKEEELKLLELKRREEEQRKKEERRQEKHEKKIKLLDLQIANFDKNT